MPSLVPRPHLPKLRRGPGTHCVRMRRNSRNSKDISVHDRYTLSHRSWLKLVEQISRLLCCMHWMFTFDTNLKLQYREQSTCF